MLLIAYDTEYPEPLHRVRPIADAFGIGLLLSPAASAPTVGRIEVEMTGDRSDALAEPPLEALRIGYPAARGLPLLRSLARRQSAPTVLDYLDHLRLAVTTTP